MQYWGMTLIDKIKIELWAKDIKKAFINTLLGA